MEATAEKITQDQVNGKAAELLAKKGSSEQAGIKSAAEKAPEDRTPEEQAQVDGFTGEVLDAIPGSSQLTPEQRRALANNLDMSNTKYGAGTVRGSGSAAEFISGSEGGLPVAEVAEATLGDISPLPAGGGQSQERER